MFYLLASFVIVANSFPNGVRYCGSTDYKNPEFGNSPDAPSMYAFGARENFDTDLAVRVQSTFQPGAASQLIFYKTGTVANGTAVVPAGFLLYFVNSEADGTETRVGSPALNANTSGWYQPAQNSSCNTVQTITHTQQFSAAQTSNSPQFAFPVTFDFDFPDFSNANFSQFSLNAVILDSGFQYNDMTNAFTISRNAEADSVTMWIMGEPQFLVLPAKIRDSHAGVEKCVVQGDNEIRCSSWLKDTHQAIAMGLYPSLAGLIFVFWTAIKVMANPVGEGEQVVISERIKEGAIGYMKTQYYYIVVFCVVINIVILAFLRQPIDPFAGHSGGEEDTVYWVMAIHFTAGAVLSSFSGVLGMHVAIRSNVRTTEASRTGLNAGLRVAFDSGSVMGMTVVCFVVGGQAILYLIFEDPIALSGFGFGASVVALFCRVGGGIFTKAADVGSDLVGKVENDIPEDSPRNPGVIADNVGDNVGDVAGLGSDLFESYVGATVAAVPLGYVSVGISGVALPFWVAGVGVLASLIGTFMVRIDRDDSAKEMNADEKAELQGQLLNALRKGTMTSGLIVIVACIPVCLELFDMDKDIAWELWGCMVIGLVAGVLVGAITEFTTSDIFFPTQSIARASDTGPATVIIRGFGVGMVSTVGPGCVLAMAALACSTMQGAYGVSIAACGMLSTLGITLATDAYGPVADNAGGIAEMAELDPRVRETTDALDALGNTTAATGKGFAIGSALLITLALVSAFTEENPVQDANGNQVPMTLDMTDAGTLSGGLIGAMLPYLFAAMTMFAVEKAAAALIVEVRRQFRTIKGLREGAEGVRPDSSTCVAICTSAAVREMVAPAYIAIISPIVFGFTFGAEFLGGVLVGSIFSGFFLGTTMANAGGAWDNAKKYTERGALGEGKLKGSDAHKATVVGDTVGDPFKDTSGPALNILSKLMAHLSLMISGKMAFGFEKYETGLWLWLVAIVVGVALYYWYNNSLRKEEEERAKLDEAGGQEQEMLDAAEFATRR